jgi:hypothetical protein
MDSDSDPDFFWLMSCSLRSAWIQASGMIGLVNNAYNCCWIDSKKHSQMILTAEEIKTKADHVKDNLRRRSRDWVTQNVQKLSEALYNLNQDYDFIVKMNSTPKFKEPEMSDDFHLVKSETLPEQVSVPSLEDHPASSPEVFRNQVRTQLDKAGKELSKRRDLLIGKEDQDLETITKIRMRIERLELELGMETIEWVKHQIEILKTEVSKFDKTFNG